MEAGDGGGPISVFTGSCLLSGLEQKLVLRMKKEKCETFSVTTDKAPAYPSIVPLIIPYRTNSTLDKVINLEAGNSAMLFSQGLTF